MLGDSLFQASKLSLYFPLGRLARRVPSPLKSFIFPEISKNIP